MSDLAYRKSYWKLQAAGVPVTFRWMTFNMFHRTNWSETRLAPLRQGGGRGSLR